MVMRLPSIWERLPFIGRLLVTASVALLAAGLTLLYVIVGEQVGHAKESMRRTADQTGALLPALVADWIVIGDYAVVKQAFDRFLAREDIAHIEYVSPSGARVSSRDDPVVLKTPLWFSHWLGLKDQQGVGRVVVGGRDYGVITVTLSAAPSLNYAWQDFIEHMTVLSVMLLVGFAGIWLVLRNALAPLTSLEAGVNELAQGASRARVLEAGSPELRRVINSFNNMSARLTDARFAILASENRMRTMFQMASDGIHIVDTHGQLLEASDSFFDMLGDDDHALLGATMSQWDAGDDCQGFLSMLIERLQAQDVTKVERRHRCMNGQIIQVEITFCTIELEGRTVLFCSSRDISERKQHEEELERYRRHLEVLVQQRTAQLEDARDRAESANRAKSTFLANMSHEIRTPLNAVLGFTNLLQHQDPRPEQHVKLSQISASAQHLLMILKDVLDLSKIEAGHMVLEEEPFELAQLVDQLRCMVEQRLHAKRLELMVDISRLPAQLDGDATRLTQALLNYIGNSVKFTERGYITLRGDVVEETEGDLLIRFEVEDTGIGIPADKVERIFDAFEQADGSITRQYGGTGLGLAINQRLAHLMHGEVGVRSKLGEGSTFWITARMRKRAVQAQIAPQASAETDDVLPVLKEQCGHFRLLLVEDDPVNQLVALEMLREIARLQVDTAGDGLEALDMAQLTHYDLILMDIQMPRLDGLSATRKLRELGEYALTPIIAMTANAFAEDRAACFKAGMSDYIAKPFDPDSLFRPIANWLTQGARMRAMRRHVSSDVGRLTVSSLGVPARTG
jgi:PAS domain S-box-containing protein